MIKVRVERAWNRDGHNVWINDLPIQATLVTREGFQKPIKIPRLERVIRITRFVKQPVIPAASTESMPENAAVEFMEFVLDGYKEVKQKNGKPHIVAVYREL